MKKTFRFSAILMVAASMLFAANCKKEEKLGENLCVINPSGICTKDINACGNASTCDCPEGYEYNNKLGKCLIKDISKGKRQGPIPDGKCSRAPDMACTKDINPCGHPSSCECGMGATYDPRSGKCLSFFKE